MSPMSLMPGKVGPKVGPRSTVSVTPLFLRRVLGLLEGRALTRGFLRAQVEGPLLSGTCRKGSWVMRDTNWPLHLPHDSRILWILMYSAQIRFVKKWRSKTAISQHPELKEKHTQSECKIQICFFSCRWDHSVRCKCIVFLVDELSSSLF